MKLYPHQVEALDLIRNYNRCAVYYDMGLGKTYIGSEKILQLGAGVNLVVCQKSKIKDWVDHFRSNYGYKVYNLTLKKELENFIGSTTSGASIVGVINYDLVFRRKELLNLTEFTLLLDESSLITNKTAKRTIFVLKMKPKNVVLLSGTPTAGKYEKLWTQLKLLGWDIGEDMFWKSYVDYTWVDRNGFKDREVKGYKNVDHLKKRLKQFGAIFKKTEEVLNLPRQVEQRLYIDPSTEYRKFLKQHYLEIDGKELIGDNVLKRILYERQLCGQYNPDKLKCFKDLIESTEDRIIVFYSFTEEFYKMKDIVGDSRPISVVNGQTKDLKAYDSFDNSITFIQYQAGAYGLNLQKANIVIYFTLPLGLGSCDLWEQSKKRIHRIGQDKTCFYYYLLCRNTIEEWNLSLLEKGKDLTDDLFERRTNEY